MGKSRKAPGPVDETGAVDSISGPFPGNTESIFWLDLPGMIWREKE